LVLQGCPGIPSFNEILTFGTTLSRDQYGVDRYDPIREQTKVLIRVCTRLLEFDFHRFFRSCVWWIVFRHKIQFERELHLDFHSMPIIFSMMK
jgi:hypothetical protein